ncbi:MAG TPA: hypothetical protein VNC50_21115 [Planctomycetia bacterium]|nr:hypothetical protein [Planctomycetia bacterium]
MRKFALAAVIAGAGLVLSASPAAAQIPVYAPPVVSYYAPPPAQGVYLPAAVPVTNYYIPPTSYYPIANPWVSYYAPSAAIVAPATVHYGLFGRANVRTPFYRIRY